MIHQETKGRFRLVVVAPARRSRGGISAAVACLMGTTPLVVRRAKWLETMDDRGSLYKLYSFVIAALEFLFLLPTADMVHVHISSRTSFFRKSYFILMASLARRRILAHIHPAHFINFLENSGKVKASFIKYVFGKADALIVLTPGMRDRLTVLFPFARIHVLPNPCPYEVRLIDNYKEGGEPTILYAGKLMETKGSGDLLEAFAQLLKHYPDVRLVMAGNGEIKKYISLADRLGISHRVSFPGWLAEENMLEQYRRASVFCLPSYSEGLPMSILDAMSQGAAVVTTPVGGIPELIRDGENGLLVTAGNVSALAKGLMRVVDDRELRDRLVAGGYKTIIEGYSVDVVAAICECIYSEHESESAKDACRRR